MRNSRGRSAPVSRAARSRVPVAGSRAARASSAASAGGVPGPYRVSRPPAGPVPGCCRQMSPSRVKRARRAGCRSTTASSARSSARSSRSWGRSSSIDMLKCRSGPCVARNHSWTGVSGAGPSSCGRLGAGRSAVRRDAAAARSATVWCRKTSCEPILRPAARARETAWMLRIESPPSSKKLSVTPTRSTPSTSAQMADRVSSSGVRGATNSRSSAVVPGAGRARRSSLPLVVSGSASSGVKEAGTSASGRTRRRAARRSAGAGRGVPGAGTT